MSRTRSDFVKLLADNYYLTKVDKFAGIEIIKRIGDYFNCVKFDTMASKLESSGIVNPNPNLVVCKLSDLLSRVYYNNAYKEKFYTALGVEFVSFKSSLKPYDREAILSCIDYFDTYIKDNFVFDTIISYVAHYRKYKRLPEVNRVIFEDNMYNNFNTTIDFTEGNDFYAMLNLIEGVTLIYNDSDFVVTESCRDSNVKHFHVFLSDNISYTNFVKKSDFTRLNNNFNMSIVPELLKGAKGKIQKFLEYNGLSLQELTANCRKDSYVSSGIVAHYNATLEEQLLFEGLIPINYSVQEITDETNCTELLECLFEPLRNYVELFKPIVKSPLISYILGSYLNLWKESGYTSIKHNKHNVIIYKRSGINFVINFSTVYNRPILNKIFNRQFKLLNGECLYNCHAVGDTNYINLVLLRDFQTELLSEEV